MSSNSNSSNIKSRAMSNPRANLNSQNISRSKSTSVGFFQSLKEKISPNSKRPPLTSRTGSRLSYTTISSRALVDNTYQISNPRLITSQPSIVLLPTIPPITRSETLPRKSSMRHLKKQHLIRRKSVPSSSILTTDRTLIPPVPVLPASGHPDKNILSSSIRGSGAIFVVEGVEFDGVKAQSGSEHIEKSEETLETKVTDSKSKRKINYKRHSYQVDGSEISPFAHEFHQIQYESPYYRQTVPMVTMATQTDPNRQSFSTSVGFDEDSNSLFMRSSSSSSASSSNQEVIYHAHRSGSFKLYDSE